MQTIDLINMKGCKVIKFPDGELHLELEDINRKDCVSIRCRITNSDDLFVLMQLSDILNRQCLEVVGIHIYYLIGMRCDRLFDINRPFTLGIVANVINSFHSDYIKIYEPHSYRTTSEIRHSIVADVTMDNYSNYFAHSNVVFPDAGAKTRYGRLAANSCVLCSKKRDEATGRLLDFEVNCDKDVSQDDLVVIDDLCDGGGTFVGLAPKLRALNPKSLSLLVTHAVQRKGIENVASVYDKVCITNSYKDWGKEDLPKNVQVIDIVNN